MTKQTSAQDSVPEFTETELWTIRSTLKERYGKDAPIELADAEVRLHPDDRVLTSCPTVFWSERGANFVLFKVGENQFRCQFFYRASEQFGTGREVYDDLGQCVITLLQVQSDHERDKSLAKSERPKSATDKKAAASDSDDSTDYYPPFWGD